MLRHTIAVRLYSHMHGKKVGETISSRSSICALQEKKTISSKNTQDNNKADIIKVFYQTEASRAQ